MEHIGAKEEVSVLILREKSAISRFSYTINGQHFVGFFFFFFFFSF